MTDSHDVFVLSIAGVVAFLLQLILAPYIAIGHAMPDFVMVFVFLCAVTRSQSFGCVMPFVLGLLYDLLSGGVVGAMSFAFTLFSYVGARVFAAMENDTLFMPIAVMSAGMLLTELVYGIFLLATGYNASFIDALIFRALPCAIYDSVIAFILYPLASRFFLSGGPASPIVATQLR